MNSSRISFLSILSVFFLNGCSPALLEPLLETQAPPPKAVLKNVTSASKTRSGDIVSVCVTITDISKAESTFTFDIPLQDRDRWQIREVVTLNKVQRTYIDYEQKLTDLRPGCTVNPIQLPLLLFDEKLFWKQAHSGSGSELVKLEQGVPEAFYLIYRYHGQLVKAGYVSSKPLLKNAHAVGVSFDVRFEDSLAVCGELLTIEERIARDEDINAKDDSGWTALHCAAREGDLKRAKRLLEKNAKVDARTDKDATPLFLASATTNVELVKVLIANKADVNAISLKGGTPLLVAARSGHAEIVRVLLENGADPKFKDPHGYTAWMWANRNKHDEVKSVLQECCAIQ